MSRRKIGVLALQGAFSKHVEVLRSLDVIPLLVRRPAELEECDGLIIPGGESTTMSRRIDFIGLKDPLHDFAQKKPVFGTCAGLILLAKEINGSPVSSLGIFDAEVERNGYGRQYDSFSSEVRLSLANKNHPFHAVFIRAPRIKAVGREVKVLAYFQDEPILIQQGNLLGAVFHPELTNDPRIHSYFLSLLP